MVTNPDIEKLNFQRRNQIGLLPVINQTKSLQAFFAATVNQLYQPEASESLVGYIGEKPYYYNPAIDVYIQEPTEQRQDYQLDPVMVSLDSQTNAIDEALFYPDLLNQLRFQGGDISNPSNLFGGDYYSWSPPIDIDEFQNPTLYYWVPEPTPYIIIGPSVTYTSDGITATYETNLQTLNPNLTIVNINGITIDPSTYILSNSTVNLTVEFDTVPDLNATIQIYINSNFDSSIIGQTTYAFPGGISLSSGVRILITNDVNANYNGNIYIIEGVGVSIFLIPDPNTISYWDVDPWIYDEWSETNDAILTPEYLTIGRGSPNDNPWSIQNRWFHMDVLMPQDLVGNSNGQRPIIEFDRSMELYNYGLYSRQNVDLVDNSNSNAFFYTQTVSNEWDEIGYDDEAWDTIEIDGVELEAGQRILFLSSDALSAQNKIFLVAQVEISPTETIFNLVLQTDGINADGSPAYGEKVYVNSGKVYGGTELWFNGTAWIESQAKTETNQAPLFQLYDTNMFQLQDPGQYPNSNFAGNKVFSYEINPNGSIDPVLGLQPTYNDLEFFVFQDYLNYINDYPSQISTYSYSSGSIIGYYFYRLYSTVSSTYDIYSHNWWKTEYNSFQYFIEQFTLTTSNIVSLNVPPVLSQDEYPLINTSVFVYQNYQLTTAYTIQGQQITINSYSNGDIIVVQYMPSITPTTENGYWSIPVNLENNPTNTQTTYLASNEMFQHFSDMLSNQPNFQGVPTNVNNSRDIPFYRSLGDQILINRAPLLKLMLVCSDKNIDFSLSVQFVEREYARFKGKFLQTMTAFYNQGILSPTTPPSVWISTILQNINLGKTSSFPFVHSGMGGDLTFIPGTPSYLGFYPIYEPTIFLDTTYSPPQNVILGHDGSITIAYNDFRDQIILSLEQQIYNSIRPVLLQREVPIFDYRSECSGGKFRRSSDFDAYWDISTAIEWVANTNYMVGNILSFNKNYFYVISDYTSSSSIGTDLINYNLLFLKRYLYSREEYVSALTPEFERWAILNQVDYRTNNTVVPGEPFTYNYSSTPDVNGDELPGYWRQIYIYYYDTDRPHTNPWEMLGLTTKPDYWDSRYGPAPYTRGNDLLWADLANGFNFSNPNATNNDFIRPGLSQFIPVDDYGNLLDPIAAGIVVSPPSYAEASAPWVFGDGGPVETAWRKSEFYPFAASMASYLMVPALFSEVAWQPDVLEFVYNQSYLIQPFTSGPQWIDTQFNAAPINSQLQVHEELNANGTSIVNTGYQQWISDYVLSQGQDITQNFGNNIRGLGVQLGYKAASFIDSDQVIVFADNFGLVPSENVHICLYQSPSIREEVYSGVIIEWNGQGWKVYGYDILNPTFQTIPGQMTGSAIGINVGQGIPVATPDWQPNTFYTIGTFVLYQNNYYRAIIANTSSTMFEAQFWASVSAPTPPPAVSLTYYSDSSNTIVLVPYGTVFYTRQDVFSFLTNYGRYLELAGWIFDTIDPTTNETRDWIFSGKEFALWSLTQWQPGSFIALSPASQQVEFQTAQGMIQSVEQVVNGVYSLLDRNGFQIRLNNIDVLRYDYEIYITPNNGTGIFCSRVSISEIENIVIFDNTTVFQDLIYSPLLGLRQNRLKLNFSRTLGWNGRIFAPGFIITNNQISANFNQTILSNQSAIVPNYEKTVTDFQRLFDIIDPVENDILRDHAYNNIDFQPRQYLTNLQITDPGSQFQFYQGMINNIGTINAFTPILRATSVNLEGTETFQIFEEWAFRVGMFGGTAIRPSIEILLQQSSIKNFVQLIEFNLFVSDGSNVPWDSGPWDSVAWDPVVPSDAQTEYNESQYGQVIEIVDEIGTNGQVLYQDPRWERRPSTFGKTFVDNSEPGNLIFPVLEEPFINQSIPLTAGYVKLGEFDFSYFDILALETSFSSIASDIEDQSRIWIYNVEGSQTWSNWLYDWTMLRVTNPVIYQNPYYPINNVIVSLSPNPTVVGNPTTVTLLGEHNLQNGELVAIPISTQTQPDLLGIHTVVLNNDFINIDDNQFLITDISIPDMVNFLMVPVESVTVIAPGINYSSIPTVMFSGGGGSGAVAAVTLQINSVSISSGGTGYVIGDILTVLGGIGTATTLTVISVSSGVVTRLLLTTAGNYTAVPTFPAATVGGSGLGCTVNLLFEVASISIVESGSGYSSPPAVTIVGGGGAGALAASTLVPLDTNLPLVFVLREVRFETLVDRDNAYNNNIPADPFSLTELVWVNDARTNSEISMGIRSYWATFIRSNLYDPVTFDLISPWRLLRRQNLKIDTLAFERVQKSSALIYDKTTNLTNQLLEIYDPAKGILSGTVETQIYYQIGYDPAIYNSGPFTSTNINNCWGLEQVGRLWWDLSTTRFLDYEIGNLFDADFYLYRSQNWGQLAPNISVDIYEWVRSTVSPTTWATYVQQDTPIILSDGSSFTPTGTVLNSDAPSFCITEEWDTNSQETITVYYFWVNLVTTVPNVPFRSISAAQIANIISNPNSSGIPWFSPISQNALVVSGVQQFLDDTDTVLQVNWSIGNSGNINHYQWILQRRTDPNSLVNQQLINKMRDSLVGWDNLNNVVPDPNLTDVERYGSFIRPRQTWFQNRQVARQNFVQVLNTIFARTSLIDDRTGFEQQIFLSTPLPTQQNNAEFAGTGQNEFTLPLYYSLDGLVVYLYDGTNFTQVENYTTTINPLTSQIIVMLDNSLLPDQTLYVNNINYWQLNIPDRSELTLITPQVGDFLLITSDSTADNFWTLYVWTGTTFNLVNAQTYRLYPDFLELVNWYAPGYGPTNVPNRFFSSLNDRNANANTLYNGDLIQWIDASTGLFEWDIYSNGIFTEVAKQNATLELNSQFYTSTILYGFDGNFDLADIPGRDGSWELKIFIDNLGLPLITNLEIDELFFEMVDYVHTEQNMIDWVFKTSYIYLGQFESQLTQTPITYPDPLTNIIDYINEIKPYHTVIRDYIQTFNLNDVANVHVTDFDLPVYYDPNIAGYRVLDPTNLNDQQILANVEPYVDWWNAYTTPNDYSLVRTMNISVLFDRVSCTSDFGWDTSPWDYIPWSFDFDISIIGAVLRVLKNGVLLSYTVVNSNTIIVDNDDNIAGVIEINFYSVMTISTVDPLPSNLLPVGSIWYNQTTDIFYINQSINYTVLPFVANWVTFNAVSYYIITAYITDASSQTFVLPDTDRAADRIISLYGISNSSGNSISDYISGCDFAGTIQDGYQFLNDVWAEYPWDLASWMGEYDTYIEDIQIQGGIVPIMAVYPVGSFDTNFFDSIPSNEPNIIFVIPGGALSDLSELFVYLNNILLIQGTDYTVIDSNQQVSVNVIQSIFNGSMSYGLSPNDLAGSNLTITIGQTFQAAPTNPYNIIIDGNAFVQPQINGNVPEELLPIQSPELLVMNVYMSREQGAPKVATNSFIGNGLTVYQLYQRPQSNQAILIYKNGLLLIQGTDYTITGGDEITFAAPTPIGSKFQIITFTIGGTWAGYDSYAWDGIENTDNYPWDFNSNIFETSYFTGDGITNEFDIDELSSFPLENDLLVTIDGVIYESNPPAMSEPYYTLVNNIITVFPTPDSGANIYVILLSNESGLCVIRQDNFDSAQGIATPQPGAPNPGGEVFTLSQFVGLAFPPEASVFATKDGLRILPPSMNFYKSNGSIIFFEMYVPYNQTINYQDVKVWKFGPSVFNSAPDSWQSMNVGPNFGFYIENFNYNAWYTASAGYDCSVITNMAGTSAYIVFRQVLINLYSVLIMLFEYNDYQIINGDQLYLIDALSNTDTLTVMSMNDNSSFQFQTQTYGGNIQGLYQLSQAPEYSSYIWVYVNGLLNILDTDYSLITQPIQSLESASIVAGGTGYMVGDLLTIIGGSGLVQALLNVVSVSSGEITELILINAGSYYVPPSTIVAPIGGSGSGCVLEITYQSNEIDFVSFSHGQNATDVLLITTASGLDTRPPIAFKAIRYNQNILVEQKNVLVTANNYTPLNFPIYLDTVLSSDDIITASIDNVNVPIFGVNISGVVSIIINSGGQGYTSAPIVVISGGGSFNPANAVAILTSGSISNIDVVSNGSNYASAPIVSFYGGGAGQVNATVVNGIVTELTIINGGQGYVNPPTVVISGGGGFGASAIAVITGGIITGFTNLLGGFGYTSAPVISFFGGGQATATANIATTVIINPGPIIGSVVMVQVNNPNLGKWEYLRISDRHKTFLIQDLLLTDYSAYVGTNPDIQPDRLLGNILAIPTQTVPGVVWIESERIEYWSISGTGVGSDPFLYYSTIIEATINSGGSNYIQNDVGTNIIIVGGTGTSAQFVITQVNGGSGSGPITGISSFPIAIGAYILSPGSVDVTTTGGSGTGLTLNLTLNSNTKRYLILGNIQRGTNGTVFGIPSQQITWFYDNNIASPNIFTFSFSSGQTVFNLPPEYVSGMTVWVFVDGIIQQNYSIVGNTIVLVNVPSLTDVIRIQIVLSDFTSSDITHANGTIVIDGNSIENVPGGFTPTGISDYEDPLY